MISWKKLTDAPIGVKLGLTSCGSILLVIGMIVSQVIGNNAVSTANAVAAVRAEVAQKATDAKAAVRGILIGRRDFSAAATADEEKAAVDMIETRGANLDEVVARVLQIANVPANRDRATKIKDLSAQWMADFHSIVPVKADVIALQARGEASLSPAESTRLATLNRQLTQTVRDKMAPAAAEMEKLSEDMATAATKGAADAKALAEAEMDSSEFKALLIGAVIVAMMIGAAAFGLFGIARPIGRLSGVMGELAAGRLETDVPFAGRGDEIGAMAKTVQVFKDAGLEKLRLEGMTAEQRKAAEDERRRNEETQRRAAAEQAAVVEALAAGLRALSAGDLTHRLSDGFPAAYVQVRDDFNAAVEKLHETVAEIATVAREVAGATGEISGGTADLSQRTEEQSASLEETSSSMEQISQNVRQNAESAEEANRLATGAREVAGRGGEVVSQAVEAMARIAASSGKIADIISVIDEIARQTNLLALNAAVEAARAGDAGRGFAVVASEVRSLAQRSSQAAKDIKDLITSSTDQVKDGVDLVNRAGGALSEILDSIGKVAEIVSQIASASREQSRGVEQINTALTQMDEVTQQNAALVEQNAAAAKALEGQAARMDEQVGSFVLAGTDAARKPAEAKSPRAAANSDGGPVQRMRTVLTNAMSRSGTAA
ncbi:MAG: methyl-accepting chemotaxis protein [Bauldia sp.]